MRARAAAVALPTHTTARSAPAPRKRRAQAHVPIGLALGLGWVLVFGLLGWLASLTILGYQGYFTAAALAAIVLLPAIGLWWVAKAGSVGGGFLGVMVLLVLLVSNLSVRGYTGGIDAQSAVKFAIWLSGLLLLPWRAGVLRLASKDMPTFALLLFGLWALLGTAYSITPLYTFAAALSFLGLWTLAVVFATSVDIGRGLLWIAGGLLAMSVASLIAYFVAPEFAMRSYENSTVLRLGGIFGNANTVGGVAALGILLSFLAWFHMRARTSLLLCLAVIPVCGACLLLSQSRSSMLGLAAGVLVVVFRRRPWWLLPTILVGASVVVLVNGYPTVLDALIGLVARPGREAQVTTFTGRTYIWGFVLSAIEKAPWLGYGFASTRELIPSGFAATYGWTTASAHSLWLQAWVSTGAVGLILMLTCQLGLFKALVTSPLPLRDGVFMYVMFLGVLEPGPAGPTVSLLTFLWIWATALTLRARQTEAALAGVPAPFEAPPRRSPGSATAWSAKAVGRG